MEKEIISMLRNLGFNQYEAKAYAFLAGHGPASASMVSSAAGIPRPRSYDVLEKLEKKGFVTKQPGRPVKFLAVDLDEAFSTYEQKKREEFEKELKEMKRIKDKVKEKIKKVNGDDDNEEMVWVLQNKKHLYSKIETLINNANESIIIATSKDGLREKLENYGDALKKARERGVDIKIIAPHDPRYSKIASEFAEFIPKDNEQRMVIADDHVLFFLTPENSKKEMGAWIKSPYFAKNVKKLF